MTVRAISIPDIRKPPAGKCEYDPKHGMRTKSDAYQGIIYGINKNINDVLVERTNIMYQLNLNPICFRFFIEFVTCRTPGTLRVRLPVSNSNGTTFKHRPERGNGRGTR